MTTASPQLCRSKVDIALGLAARAWETHCQATGRAVRVPAAVVPLKSQRPGRKSGVYRLEGVGEDGAAVVAKRTFRSTARVERDVYERILPRAKVPALRYYGFLEEPDGNFCWLFLEDAGERKLTESDGPIAAEWLAQLHTRAAPLIGEVPLPDRGPAHYLEHLRAGRTLIEAALVQVMLPDEDRVALRDLLRHGQRLEAQWARLTAACATAPTTLVHGDFARKNLRLREGPDGTQMVALDWETAGWGPPAADLPFSPTRCRRDRPDRSPDKPRSWSGTVPLDVYAAHCSRWRGDARISDLVELGRAGTLFRIVAGIRWAAEQQEGGIFSGVKKLRWYAELLPRALAAAD